MHQYKFLAGRGRDVWPMTKVRTDSTGGRLEGQKWEEAERRGFT